MKSLVVFGSARIDAFMSLPEDKAQQFCKLDEKDCVIALSYAAKLPLEKVDFLVGGNGANVAVGTRRLGVESILISELGEGPLANYARKKLEEEGISLQYVTQSKGVKEGFGAVIVYQGERTILSYYAPQRPPFPNDLEEQEWAYLTSVGEQFEEFYDDVYNWLGNHKTKLAFNPGGRQIAKGKSWLSKYLQKTDLLLVNREEAETISATSDSRGREKDLLDALSQMGPSSVVVTDGGDGSFAKDSDKYYRVGILPIDSIERTGAGDSYSTGCLAALIGGRSMKEAMHWGTVNAASVVGYVGPEDGLLTKDKIKEWCDRARSSGVEVVEF